MELSQVGDGSAKPGPSFGGRSWTSKIPGSIRVHRCSSVVEFLSVCIDPAKLCPLLNSRRNPLLNSRRHANGFVLPSDEWVVRNTLRRLRRELGTPAQGKARC
jgi:hypothetical protein